MVGHCSTGQSPQWAVVPMEEVVVGCCGGVLVSSGIRVHGVVFSNGGNYLTLIFFHPLFSS